MFRYNFDGENPVAHEMVVDFLPPWQGEHLEQGLWIWCWNLYHRSTWQAHKLRLVPQKLLLKLTTYPKVPTYWEHMCTLAVEGQGWLPFAILHRPTPRSDLMMRGQEDMHSRPTTWLGRYPEPAANPAPHTPESLFSRTGGSHRSHQCPTSGAREPFCPSADSRGGQVATAHMHPQGRCWLRGFRALGGHSSTQS